MRALLPRITGLLPQHALNRLAQGLGNCALPWVRRPLIRWFIRRYGVDMSEAAEPNPEAYPCFNAFFTRALRAGARPIAPREDAVASPADGILSGFGSLSEGKLMQAKGRYYSLGALLADETEAAQFAGGHWMCVYLSPKDYHRVHMPLTGKLRRSWHIRGRLFPVNPAAAETVPNLLAENERRVCLLEGAAGPFALVFVGALIVGSIRTAWDSDKTPAYLSKGDEAGYFCLGSTVVAVFSCPLQMAASLVPGSPVRCGQRLGSVLPTAAAEDGGGDARAR